MSFKASGPKTRPERVKPPQPPEPTDSIPLPSSFSGPKKASHRRSSSASSHSSKLSGSDDEAFHDARFSASEEATMVSQSNTLKSAANTQFIAADYSSALSTYDRAMSELPSYLDYEMAVIQSNIAACHMRLSQWKEAVDSAEAGLAGLEREMPTKPKQAEDKAKRKHHRKSSNGSTGNHSKASPPPTTDPSDETIIELPSDASDSELATQLAALNLSDARKTDITRIRLKLLLRHARSLVQLVSTTSTPPSTPSPNPSTPSFTSTWTLLSQALQSYTTLAQTPNFSLLPPSDQRTVLTALRDLPPKVDEAKSKEMGEMMGKLKELGNGILKPFGLSTNMFKAKQDPVSGGWSLGFDQGKQGS